MQTRDLMHAKEILKLSYSQQRNYLKLDHVRNILFLPVEEAALGAQAPGHSLKWLEQAGSTLLAQIPVLQLPWPSPPWCLTSLSPPHTT